MSHPDYDSPTQCNRPFSSRSLTSIQTLNLGREKGDVSPLQSSVLDPDTCGALPVSGDLCLSSSSGSRRVVGSSCAPSTNTVATFCTETENPRGAPSSSSFSDRGRSHHPPPRRAVAPRTRGRRSRTPRVRSHPPVSGLLTSTPVTPGAGVGNTASPFTCSRSHSWLLLHHTFIRSPPAVG